jgi:putative ABC transport system substrate-binding protein
MKRRAFVAALGGAAAWSLVASAQERAKIARIGFLSLGPSSASSSRVEAFRVGLRDLGYIEGKNIVIDFRWADSVDQLSEFAAELARMKVDVILAPNSTMVEAARQATKTIPIVFTNHADPVGISHVASLARPSGNITGLSMMLTELVTKEFEIFTGALPQASLIGVLWNPTTPSHPPALEALKAAAAKLGVQLRLEAAQTTEDLERAFASMAQEQVDGFILVGSPLFTAQRALLAELALKDRLPGMLDQKGQVEAGGLMSYGADIDDLSRRAAVYVDKILRGAKPSDLPVGQSIQIRTRNQSKDSKGARPNHPANAARPRRRSHRMNLA